MESSSDVKGTLEKLGEIYHRKRVPRGETYLESVRRMSRTLDEEDDRVRPKDSMGRAGGIVYLDPGLPTVIVPDLHARMDFLFCILQHRFNDTPNTAELLEKGKLQIVCVGDGFHAEGRARQRWLDAFEEFKGNFRKHRWMDSEMRESLGLMQMVMEIKWRFPGQFHFLKGNHENISNEDGEGNHPFGKFVYEGEMVAQYVRKFFGDGFLKEYYALEKKLPVMAVGNRFLVTHAEPRVCHPKSRLVEYHSHPEVVYDLTWTKDGEAEEGSVAAMLSEYLEKPDGARLFGGHRSISERYNTRAGGLFVQIHNPHRFIMARLEPGREIDPERDVIELAKKDCP